MKTTGAKSWFLASMLVVSCQTKEAPGPHTSEETATPETTTQPESTKLLSDFFDNVEARVSEVFLPSPTTIFDAIDNLGRGSGQTMRLSEHIREIELEPADSFERTALLAGVAISDFFVAVSDQSLDTCKELRAKIETLSKDLGVYDEVSSEAESLGDALRERKWTEVRASMGTIYDDMKTTLVTDSSTSRLATYVAMGAWLESLRLLTEQLEASYDTNIARLLRQAEVASFFQKRLSESEETDDSTEEMRSGLDGLEKLLDVERSEPVPKDRVEPIRNRVNELLAKTGA